MASIGGRALTSGEIRAGLAQDLVGLAQLAVLALQRFEALTLIGRDAGFAAGISLGLVHPTAQRLGRTADLGRDRHDRCPLRGVLRSMLTHHPDSALTHLRRKMWCL
jgi:hypothetical protein